MVHAMHTPGTRHPSEQELSTGCPFCATMLSMAFSGAIRPVLAVFIQDPVLAAQGSCCFCFVPAYIAACASGAPLEAERGSFARPGASLGHRETIRPYMTKLETVAQHLDLTRLLFWLSPFLIRIVTCRIIFDVWNIEHDLCHFHPRA